MKKLMKLLRPVMVISILAGLSLAGYYTRGSWLPLLKKDSVTKPTASGQEAGTDSKPKKVILSDQAIKNLGLKVESIKPDTYEKKIQIPGLVVDRPGHSDRVVVSPVSGVVARVHHLPGDNVRHGDVLFTLRLLSESMHKTQSNLFQATLDTRLAQAEKKRLDSIKETIQGTQIIENANRIARLQASISAYKCELINRGLTLGQIEEVTRGHFATEITITVPPRPEDTPPLTVSGLRQAAGKQPSEEQPIFEVEEVQVDPGQQVQAGQTLCHLGNHQLLSIEGRAFPDETLLLEQSVAEDWPVKVDFQENPNADWDEIKQEFHIRHLANTIDPISRTFAFRMPLQNQSKVVQTKDKTQILWRFRPGQKLRLHVRVKEIANVYILPAEAVAREGANAYVFTRNVNTFERLPVVLLAQDRQHAVLANEQPLIQGDFVVQNGAAQLNRMVNAGTDNGVPKGYHIHADGSLHKNEEEGK